MSEASAPSLPAIRERLQQAEQAKAAWNAGAAAERERLDHYGPEDGDWQAFLTRALTADRTLGSAWAALLHHAPADLAFLLALVTDLTERMQVTQAENRRVWDDTESLRGEVARLQSERDGLRATLEKTTNCLGKCAMWLPHEDKRRRTQRVMSAARKALAALPADACVACTYDRGAKVQLCAACAARAALGEE